MLVFHTAWIKRRKREKKSPSSSGSFLCALCKRKKEKKEQKTMRLNKSGLSDHIIEMCLHQTKFEDEGKGEKEERERVCKMMMFAVDDPTQK